MYITPVIHFNIIFDHIFYNFPVLFSALTCKSILYNIFHCLYAFINVLQNTWIDTYVFIGLGHCVRASDCANISNVPHPLRPCFDIFRCLSKLVFPNKLYDLFLLLLLNICMIQP